MKITVTQEDIDKGVPGHSYENPIARAMARATGQKVWAGYTTWWFKSPDNAPAQVLPLSATKFAYKFDALEPVQPFEFEVEVPS